MQKTWQFGGCTSFSFSSTVSNIWVNNHAKKNKLKERNVCVEILIHLLDWKVIFNGWDFLNNRLRWLYASDESDAFSFQHLKLSPVQLSETVCKSNSMTERLLFALLATQWSEEYICAMILLISCVFFWKCRKSCKSRICWWYDGLLINHTCI